MSIIAKDKVFVIENTKSHYVFGINENGFNQFIHWGEKCPVDDYSAGKASFLASAHSDLDEISQELTPFGLTMYRNCGIKAVFPDGCREISLDFDSFENSDNVLKVKFRDKHYPLEITLNYQTYDDSDILTKWITVENTGEQSIIFEKLLSGEFSLPGVKPYNFENTNGSWGAEFKETKTLLDGGMLTFESRKGTSSHTYSPQFIAYQNADENSGKVYFAVLEYSGNFKVEASRDLYGKTRIIMGLNDFDFEYELKPAEHFDTPKIHFGLTEGFGEMSRSLNRFAINHIFPRKFAKTPLPVLYNSWEATWFDVNTAHQTELAKKASQLGVELFVMDDGWFGQRNNDRAGLGDWVVNKDKFPNGLDELINNVNNSGMDFGIWVEPEMVNPDSDLYRAHPDWAYHYDTRTSSELRNQLVLNMTKPEVQEYIYNCLNDLLSRHNIKYIKWDMNRPFSETGCENLEHPKMLWYLHTKAVYDILEMLRIEHPDVQFECCSSGGGRADWGAFKHFDMIWTSDNTDAIDRLAIQNGYLKTRPTKAMRAWVTDTEGYNRKTPLEFRFHVAMRGSLSLGGNLTKYSDEDVQICKEQVELYKSIRDIIQFGDLYRLLNLDEDEISADIYVNENKTKAVLFIASVNTRCYKKSVPLLLKGLDEKKKYTFKINGSDVVKSGAYLANVGINIEIRDQYHNEIIIINED
jgi:alpha-galactosidase